MARVEGTIAVTGLPPYRGLIFSLCFYRVDLADAPAPYGYLGYPAPPPPPAYQPYGYPPTPTSSGQPSNIMGACVLAYIAAGLLILAALLLFLGASVVSSLRDTTRPESFGTELAVDGVLDVILAALLITGGVLLTSRRVAGRTLITVSAALCAADAIYWAVRIPSGGIGFYVLLFVSLPTIAAALTWTPSSAQWLAAHQYGPTPPRG